MADDIEQVFKKHKVVPDVISAPPKEYLAVTYSNGVQAEKGVELTPTQVKAQPKVEWNAEENALYTLIMTDPDAPSRKDPKFREYQHWLVVNIPGNNIDKGDVLTAYVGAGPPNGSGLHRYILLLFKQSESIQATEPRIPKNSGTNRGRFNTTKFAHKYKLCELVAANFFQAQWDDYVPKLYKQLSGK